MRKVLAEVIEADFLKLKSTIKAIALNLISTFFMKKAISLNYMQIITSVTKRSIDTDSL